MDDATLSQNRAADPQGSTWLSANAGSGKTKVLIDRVARLLLRGTPPQRILCLTYTKAAASEMQNRLFQRLGGWAMLGDAALSEALVAMGEGAVDASLLADARRLFARAIETPGGLKIQTIHAFCSSLLRRFPLEAGVSPDFSEVDDRSLQQLRLDVLDRLSTGADAGVMRTLMRRLDEGSFSALLAEIGKHRDAFNGPFPNFHAVFGLAPGLTEGALVAQVFDTDTQDLLARVVPLLRAGSANDLRLAAKLAQVRSAGIEALEVLEGALLTQSGAAPFTAKTGKHATKDTQRRIGPDDLAALDALGERIEGARPLRLALGSLGMAEALHRFARIWLPMMDAAKMQRGWLEFDDLIRLAGRLLGQSTVAQWVLFKLDGGIDHILIDEAQDTSPAQWRVVDLLTQEFTAGVGARDTRRTIFVVGDRKQSIYSFQGADLQGFEQARERFAQRLGAIGEGLSQQDLRHSFRSSDAILRLVDLCFQQDSGGLGGAPVHLAFRDAAPGRVDLWPAIPPAEKPGETEWDSPLDRPAPDDPQIVLAGQIAASIREMIDRGEQVPVRGGARPMHEGDVLILVRRRGTLFDALIRACKVQGLAIAGADRMQLGEELAVQDLIALLRFLALPEDDLSLAVALRSPLFGLSEDDLFRLAHRRKGYLWSALKSDPRHARTWEILQDLRDQVDFLRPYELLERVLTRHDGRRRIRARLGDEVGDAVEAFVELALDFEAEHVPTLDGFLGWIMASDAEVKRQAEAGGRRLRVMTVHGAKGLEAPIVILPDTDARTAPRREAIALANGVPILRATKGEATAAQADADAEQQALLAAESDRLLYVALTRAESWLIVAGAGKTDDPNCWHARVSTAFGSLAPVPLDTPAGKGRRHSHGHWPEAQPGQAQPMTEGEAEAFALRPLPVVAEAPRLLTPTSLGGAKALAGAGDDTEVAMARGRVLHALLEQMPEARDPAQRAASLLDGVADADAIRAEAEAVLNDPALGFLFEPAALVEVTVTGDWMGRRMWGIVDRLMVSDDRVLAVDFKSNRQVPTRAADVPEGLLRQMGAYAHLLGAIYPGRRIETALLWTAERRFMPLDPGLTAAALDRAALDPAVAGP